MIKKKWYKIYYHFFWNFYIQKERERIWNLVSLIEDKEISLFYLQRFNFVLFIYLINSTEITTLAILVLSECKNTKIIIN